MSNTVASRRCAHHIAISDGSGNILPGYEHFLQFKVLEELTWQDISAADDIRLVVPLTVIEEIDKKKNEAGRKADRSRKISTKLRQINKRADKKIVIRERGPHVSLELAPLFSLKSADFSEFDLLRADNRILAEMKRFVEGNPFSSVSFLTDDTIPMIVAEALAVPTE